MKNTRTVKIPATIQGRVQDRLMQREARPLARRVGELRYIDKLELNLDEAKALHEALIPLLDASPSGLARSWMTLWRRCGQVIYQLADNQERFRVAYEGYRRRLGGGLAAIRALGEILDGTVRSKPEADGFRVEVGARTATGQTLLEAVQAIVAKL